MLKAEGFAVKKINEREYDNWCYINMIFASELYINNITSLFLCNFKAIKVVDFTV